MNETPICVRCQEDFPVEPRAMGPTMGYLRLLADEPKWIRAQFPDNDPSNEHLCGNCHFDLCDERDDRSGR